ncbi:MAG: hypothetical protein ACI9GM_000027 [Salibacteraceae bacterium]|jgi:hypothetical protein
MKNAILTILLVVASMYSYGQSQYSTLTNRVIISTIVNSDTVLLENLNNKVKINGELDLLEVVYDNSTSRIVSDVKNLPEDRADIQVKFYNEYTWLYERIKFTETTIHFKDVIIVEINGEEQTVPANFDITRIRGARGFKVMIEIRGLFSGEQMEQDFPHLKFESEVGFAIFLRVQVVN